MAQIVSLTTDLGLKDYYVAALKGAIHSRIDPVQIVDISHTIEPYDIVQASLFLGSTFACFPSGTIHIAGVRNYYSRHNEIIALERDGHYFIGPNNGLFSLIWTDLSSSQVYRIATDELASDNLTDVLAHAAAYLSHGLPLEEIGPPILELEQKMTIQPVVTADQVRATIIHIDQFDNAIVNLRREAFEKLRAGRRVKLYFKHDDPIYHFSKQYSDVPVGDPLALWNSAGYLEIAVNMGKASSLYNLNKNETIQIYFVE